MDSYKLIIFDWDGTLMDSVGRIVSSMQSAAAHCSLVVPTISEVKEIIGLSLPNAFETLFPMCNDEQYEAMSTQYKYQYVEGDKTPSPLFNNAIPLLKALKNESKLLAVATGKGRQGLQRVLQSTETEHFFNATRCAGEVLSKPDPEMILSLLDELSILPENALMIGDTSHDMKMAEAAGVDRIGITLGVHNREILNRYSPKVVVDSLEELQNILIPQEVVYYRCPTHSLMS
jgi:phosphoglycolate phosphatase